MNGSIRIDTPGTILSLIVFFGNRHFICVRRSILLDHSSQSPFNVSTACHISTITRIAMTINIAIEKLIHSGDSTHNHGQVIPPVSLSAMKRIVSNPTNPIPPDELLDELLLISLIDPILLDVVASLDMPHILQ